ncbi:class I SAM-dependent methyltransferase [Thiobaca trueperi]|nr:class I SAM-dependent methyltransferase [Thiobaca trueperi]
MSLQTESKRTSTDIRIGDQPSNASSRTALMKQQWQRMAEMNPFFGITSWPEFEDSAQLDTAYFWDIGRIHAHNLLQKVPLRHLNHLSMVEIGCGVGRMTHFFAECFAQVTAMDISREMITRARDFWGHLEHVRFIEGNGADLKPVADSDIDFVFSFYVLNHVTNPEVVLGYVRETGRVLKDGGHALLHMRVRDLPDWSQARLRSKLRRIGRPLSQQLWWNEGIVRREREMKTDLIGHFSEFDAWHGCEVPWPDLINTLRESGLDTLWVDIAEMGQTKFVFLVLRKQAA